METYEIVEGQTPDGTPWYCVLQWIGDRCMGGDHHWLKREHAVTAMSGYEIGMRAFPGSEVRVS